MLGGVGAAVGGTGSAGDTAAACNVGGVSSTGVVKGVSTGVVEGAVSTGVLSVVG